MPKTITKEVYSYKELCEANARGEMQRAYEKARDWLIEGVMQFDWYADTLEQWTEQLAEIGFLDAKIYFSGFWNQGDGACFDAYCDVIKLIENLKEDPSYNQFKDLLGLDFQIIVNQLSSHYCHERARYIDIDLDELEFTEEQLASIKELEESIESMRLDLCREIYSDLEKEYKYRTSDEALIEDAEANRWMFNDGGWVEYA